MVPLPSSMKRRLPSLATVIPTGLPQNIPIGRDEAGNEIFVLAARSHVVAVVEARRWYAFARADQFGAGAIAVTAIHLSLHRFSQSECRKRHEVRTTRERLATKVVIELELLHRYQSGDKPAYLPQFSR